MNKAKMKSETKGLELYRTRPLPTLQHPVQSYFALLQCIFIPLLLFFPTLSIFLPLSHVPLRFPVI